MDEEYFSRIEEHFGRLRGGPLLLSPREWELVRSWWEKGIPLEVVLRGIRRAFDKFEERKLPGKIGSLFYCEHEVLATFREYREALVGGRKKKIKRKEAPFSYPALKESLSKARDTLLKLSQKQGKGELRRQLIDIASRVDEISLLISSENPPSWEELDERLSLLDSELTEAFFSHIPEEEFAFVSSRVRKELASYQDKMDPTTYEETLRRLTLRELRNHYRLPRLDLFSLLK